MNVIKNQIDGHEDHMRAIGVSTISSIIEPLVLIPLRRKLRTRQKNA